LKWATIGGERREQEQEAIHVSKSISIGETTDRGVGFGLGQIVAFMFVVEPTHIEFVWMYVGEGGKRAMEAAMNTRGRPLASLEPRGKHDVHAPQTCDRNICEKVEI
jgi:hypothetical protein